MESRINFTMSLRDRYILAQALILGIEKLGEDVPPYQEISNMQDMADMLMQPEFILFVGGILIRQPGEPCPYPVTAALMADRMTGLTEVLKVNEGLPAIDVGPGEVDDDDLPF